jgi:MscS family membrane protein
MMGFLKNEGLEDYAAAALYLQAPAGRRTNMEQQIKQLRALRRTFKGDIGHLSNDPAGSAENGLPPGQVRAGTLQVGDATSDVILVRVDDPTAGKIWLISKETVAGAAKLLAIEEKVPPTLMERALPAVLTRTEVLGMSLAEWLAWLLSIPISILLAWPLCFLLTVPKLLLSKLRGHPFKPVWETPLGKPLRYIVATLINSVSIYLLKPPLLYRVYYLRLMGALLAACFIWLLGRIIDRGFEHALNRARTQRTGAESILMLTQRVLRIVLLLVAIVAVLAALGFNMRTELAGLGIGGLAVALAAQKTLENVLSGVSLLMDKALQAGNACKIGGQVGIVEDVGLRSVKVRTNDQTLLVVPNGALAQMQFENFASRQKCLINQHFSLRIETEVGQLRLVLDRVQAMLDQYPSIDPATSRVRVANFAGASFELELWAYVQTGDWARFTMIRQDVILKIAEIVAASGTQFAAPTQLTYLSQDAGIDAKQPNDGAREVTAFTSLGSESVRPEPAVVPH